MNRIAAFIAAVCLIAPSSGFSEEPDALYKRGLAVLEESTLPAHHADGAALIARAAEQGHAAAQYHLGYLYSEGLGVERSPGKAAIWFRRAAEQGHAAGQYATGLSQLRSGNKRDAAHWLFKAAAQGLPDAQFQLALLYEKGDGVAKDEAEARRLYAAAAKKNDPASMLNLALMLDQGRGGPVDLQGALDWYVKASEAELPEARHALCEILLDGRGVAPDPENGAGWCLAAAEQGYAPAQMLLATLYALGRGVAADEARAAAWLTLAAEQNYPPAIKAREGLLPHLPQDVREKAETLVKTLRPAP